MAATRLSMRQEVIYMIGNRTELNTNADSWVARAYQHLTQTVEFPEAALETTIATVVGTRDYTLPTNYFSVYSARNNTVDKRIVQVSQSHYDALPTANTGPVDRYAVFIQTIKFHPTPASVESVQVRYRKFFAELAADDTAHELPAVWDSPIIWLAASYGFEHLNEIERARHYRSSTRNFVREQESRLSAELIDRNEAMGPIGMEIR